MVGAAAVALAASSVSAGIYSFDMAGGGTLMATSDSAGVIPAANWNTNAGIYGTGSLQFQDSSGTNSYVGGSHKGWGYQGNGGWGNNSSATNGDERMMLAGLYMQQRGSFDNFEVSGPTTGDWADTVANCDVYIYYRKSTTAATATFSLKNGQHDTNTDPDLATFTLNAGSGTYAGSYVEATSGNGWVGNYIKLSGIQATATSWSGDPFIGLHFGKTSVGSDSSYALVGVQIVPAGTGVPEPTTLSMLGLGAVGLLARRRR
jgi:hypothetical protein